jgi:hypothetical protein
VESLLRHNLFEMLVYCVVAIFPYMRALVHKFTVTVSELNSRNMYPHAVHAGLQTPCSLSDSEDDFISVDMCTTSAITVIRLIPFYATIIHIIL